MLSLKVICVSSILSSFLILSHSAIRQSFLCALLSHPSNTCMPVGSDLAWGAIVLSLIKRWTKVLQIPRKGPLLLPVCFTVGCGQLGSTCCKEWVRSPDGREHDRLFFFFFKSVFKRCTLQPLDGDVIPFFTAAQVLLGPTVVAIWKPWSMNVVQSCCCLHFHYYAAGDEHHVESNRHTLPPHLQRTRLIFWPLLIETSLFFPFPLSFLSHNRLICPQTKASPTVWLDHNVGGEVQINRILDRVATSWPICF